jgi:uncharacterized protein (DUF3084 family)
MRSIKTYSKTLKNCPAQPDGRCTVYVKSAENRFEKRLKLARLDVNSARLDVNSARLSANSAQLDANSAQLIANSAQLSANSAQLSANSAQLDANSAQLDAKNEQINPGFEENHTVFTSVNQEYINKNITLLIFKTKNYV